MAEIDKVLEPFALWLGLGLTKLGIVLLGVALCVVVWRGTTDPDSYGD